MSISPAAISILFGLVLTTLYAWMWACPDRSDAALRAFPRSVLPARILVSICLVWFALNLWGVDLGRFNDFKYALFVAVPVGYVLILRYTPDLLAVRGLCAFILLSAQTVINTVRWQGTPATTAVTVLVYLLILKSMLLVVYPHLWIRGLNRLKRAPAPQRKACLGAGIGVGVVLLVCGVLSF